jgi:hypothetical protein
VAANELDSMADSSGALAPIAPSGSHSPANRLVLHLGVLDVPYSIYEQAEKTPKAKKGKANKPIKPKSNAATKTIGDVAEILEEKYGVLDTFAFARLPDIAHELEESIAGELENLLMGAPPSGNPFNGAESAITTMMKKFISSQAIEHMGVDGVPTQAALSGVNHRLKHPYAKANERRPSFMDTTLYWQHLIAWID